MMVWVVDIVQETIEVLIDVEKLPAWTSRVGTLNGVRRVVHVCTVVFVVQNSHTLFCYNLDFVRSHR